MKKSAELFLGLMSGTSMDGIDAAIVRFGDRRCEVLAGHCAVYPGSIRSTLRKIRKDPDACTVDELGQLDNAIGEQFAAVANELLESSGFRHRDIVAIGSHGQTLRHQPGTSAPFTLQVGDPNIIAARTGITVVADFRRRDLAESGQGAPLTPAFHQWLFADEKRDKVVLNIGGIANITVLAAGGAPVTGFDTGPGNTLLDAWISANEGVDFDDNGAWASRGQPSKKLLDVMLKDNYFTVPPPKSTGFEYFNLTWLEKLLAGMSARPSPQDMQATLVQLTCRSIADAINSFAPGSSAILVCGGGVHNRYLMGQLASCLPEADVQSTATQGLDPDWVEAAAFAWLAKSRIEGRPGNLPSVTGASRSALLGGIYAG